MLAVDRASVGDPRLSDFGPAREFEFSQHKTDIIRNYKPEHGIVLHSCIISLMCPDFGMRRQDTGWP